MSLLIPSFNVSQRFLSLSEARSFNCRIRNINSSILFSNSSMTWKDISRSSVLISNYIFLKLSGLLLLHLLLLFLYVYVNPLSISVHGNHFETLSECADSDRLSGEMAVIIHLGG